MLPLVLYGSVLTKLRGFAIATIVGVLVGVVITRPFFGEIAKMIVSDTEKQTILKQQKEKKEEQLLKWKEKNTLLKRYLQ